MHPVYRWCQIGAGAKLTPFTLLVPNLAQCQIESGAKSTPVPNCPPIVTSPGGTGEDEVPLVVPTLCMERVDWV